MKGKKVAASLLGIFASVTAFGGCEEEKTPTCAHEYNYYAVKQATCTEKGLIEETCALCGKKNYKEVEATGHTMVWGQCSVCGYDASATPPSEDEPVNPSVFYTLNDLYEQALLLKYVVTEEEFYEIVDDTTLSNIYVNGKGRLKLTTDDGLLVDLGEVRRTFTGASNDASALADGLISQISIKLGKLSVLYGSGTMREIGDLKSLGTSTNPIVGILLNEHNEVYVLFECERVAYVGMVGENPTELAESALVYKEYDYGYGYEYCVSGAMDKGVKEIDIPSTHLGKTVSAIGSKAFQDYALLEKVKIAEGYTYIPYYAFKNCSALSEVHIPRSVTSIDLAAFENCAALKTVYFAGTQEEWDKITVGGLNEALQNATVVCQGD